jgi:hypothetical protein
LFLLAFSDNRGVDAKPAQRPGGRLTAYANIQNADAHIHSSAGAIVRIAIDRHNYATAISGHESLLHRVTCREVAAWCAARESLSNPELPKAWAIAGAFSPLTLVLKLAQYCG